MRKFFKSIQLFEIEDLFARFDYYETGVINRNAWICTFDKKEVRDKPASKGGTLSNTLTESSKTSITK